MDEEKPETADYVALYRRAFREFGSFALWNLANLENPTPGHARVIARALRYEGNLAARRLAEQIEAACAQADDSSSAYAGLYRRAFREFGATVLGSSRQVPNPTPEDALAITRSLRVEGNLEARRLAEQIEQACYALI